MRRDDLHTYQFNIQQQPLITFHLSPLRYTNNSQKDPAYLAVFAYMETMPMSMNRTCVFYFQTHHLAQRMHIIIINHRFESTSNAHLVF